MFEGIDPRILGAARALARELRYRELTGVVGRRVLVDSVASVDAVVRAAVPEIPPAAELVSTHTSEMLGKHGILYLEYRVPSIEAPPVGWRGLRALGLLGRDPLETPEELAITHELVFDLLERCRRGDALALVFLQGPRPEEVVRDWVERGGWRGGLVEEYLPQELDVIDACETNCSTVWVSKHFYM